jgi:hypothetical protein
MTIERRLRDDPAFPPPSRFSPTGKGPRKWSIEQIEAYERAAAARPPPVLKPLRRQPAPPPDNLHPATALKTAAEIQRPQLRKPRRPRRARTNE